MKKEELFSQLLRAIVNYEQDKVDNICKNIVQDNIDPTEAIERGVRKGLGEVGQRFEREELFIPELLAAGKTAEKAIKVLTSGLQSCQEKYLGRVVIGTVRGDIHDLGKNIVTLMLRTAGFEVFDLGIDVPPESFIEKIQEVNSDIVGLSALMMTTLPAQREVIEALIESNLRSKVKVMVGGVATSDQWAKEIGADAYADNASIAVRKAKELLRRR